MFGPSTVRLLSDPPIFAEIKIGRDPLAIFTASELRWLIGFFVALGECIGRPASDAASASRIFSVAQIKRAVARGDRMRGRG